MLRDVYLFCFWQKKCLFYANLGQKIKAVCVDFDGDVYLSSFG